MSRAPSLSEYVWAMAVTPPINSASVEYVVDVEGNTRMYSPDTMSPGLRAEQRLEKSVRARNPICIFADA